jgi:hypothetical protein
VSGCQARTFTDQAAGVKNAEDAVLNGALSIQKRFYQTQDNPPNFDEPVASYFRLTWKKPKTPVFYTSCRSAFCENVLAYPLISRYTQNHGPPDP